MLPYGHNSAKYRPVAKKAAFRKNNQSCEYLENGKCVTVCVSLKYIILFYCKQS